jgi:enoyl-CoA hydratase/carnithine racemase
MAYELQRDGAVGLLTMNRPPANAYTKETLRVFQRCISEARDDSAIRCVVLRSASEKFFSAGADISTLDGAEAGAFADFLTVAHETLAMIERTPKIFIAAIAGHCIGGGLEIALACDFRFAAERQFGLGLAEINLGLSPGMGGTQRLPRLIGRSRALGMMLNGQPIAPPQALEWGLIDRLYPAEAFAEEVAQFAARLAAGPSRAQGLIKLSVNEGLAASFDQGLAIERANQATLFASADAQEGVRAFREKRKPQFKGC